MEPSPTAREILEFNIEKNGVSDRTEVIADAAGVDGGTMYAMPNWHHLEAKSESKGAISVCTRSIDAICGEYSCIPDMMKVDVEGSKFTPCRVQAGYSRPDRLVYLEIHPQLTAQLGYDHTKCFDLMSEAGYDITEVSGQPLTRGQFRQRHHTFFTVCRWVRPKVN